MVQLIANDRFISVVHRVLASQKVPRISIGSCFVNYDDTDEGISKVYGPIEELLSEENKALYKDTSVRIFDASFLKGN